jgi:hypothetical protein
MALVIKTHQNKTHQNNNKKHINFFGERPEPINLFWGDQYYFLMFFYSLKNLFEEMEGTLAQPVPPPSISECL